MSDRTPKILKRTQFGDPILLKKTRQLSEQEITSHEIQNLIADMKFTLATKRFGVGIAANQVGHSISLSVINIQPQSYRPDVQPFAKVIINPRFKRLGKKYSVWEGCLSMGSKNSPVFAKTMRYRKIEATYYDERGIEHTEILHDLPAHVFQHETDHLNGIIFPERVHDHSTWMNFSEYKKMKKASV